MGTIKINLADALFSQVAQRVLGKLFGQPDRSFYMNEMIRLTRSGKGAVQRELEKLFAAGIVTVKQMGNQKYYQANRDLPFFNELRGIVIKTFGLADILQNAFKPTMAEKIHFAFIYGSYARQEDTATSDIDLMIITDSLTYVEIFKALEKTEAQLERKVNPTVYSLETWLKKRNQNNHFITQVISLPKIFLIGTENEFNKLG